MLWTKVCAADDTGLCDDAATQRAYKSGHVRRCQQHFCDPGASSASGAQEFGVDLTEHIQFIIEALKPLAGELGLEKGLATGDET